MEDGLLRGWEGFFVAEAGAAAALAGLLFIAVSINLERILVLSTLPTRALETLLALLSVLVVATFGLVPGQTALAYGIEFAATGACVWIMQTIGLVSAFRHDRKHGFHPVRIIFNQLPSLSFVVAGVMIALGYDEGAYWLAPGVILSFLGGMYGAWVLLIEIQR